MKCLEKMMKKMDCFDISLVKLAVAAFVLFIITIWSAALTLVLSVNPWYFLIAFIIFAIRPMFKVFSK